MTTQHPADPDPSPPRAAPGVEAALDPAVDAPGRRRFLQACVGGMTVVSAGTVAFPVVSFFRLPATLSEAQVLRIPLASLAEDQALYKELMGRSLVVLYTRKVPKVFDAACTHLGCIVAWDGVKRVFRCPCHGAIFDDEGRPVSGPVSRPLQAVEMQVTDTEIVVS